MSVIDISPRRTIEELREAINLEEKRHGGCPSSGATVLNLREFPSDVKA
jgi:hypothetical protein